MPVDYEVFRRQSWNERVGVFNALSNEEKAELVKTHIRRWLESRREALTPDQIRVVEENLAFITADLYDLAQREENMARMKDLEARTSALFSREEMREAFTMHWDQAGGIRNP